MRHLFCVRCWGASGSCGSEEPESWKERLRLWFGEGSEKFMEVLVEAVKVKEAIVASCEQKAAAGSVAEGAVVGGGDV